VLRERVQENPAAIAIVFKGRAISVADLDRASDALAHSLVRLGVKHGDRVALLLPNAPQFMISQFATWKIGAICAPQNPIHTDRELEESMGASEPDSIITLTPFYERVKRCQRATGVKHVIATNIKEHFPGGRCGSSSRSSRKKKDGASHHHRFRRSLAGHDDAMILMSGGTTGTPKGTVSDHRSLVMTGIQISTWLHEPLSGDASIMLPLPLFHAYGSGAALPAAMLGHVPLILVPNPRDISDVIKTIEHEKPSVFCAVPTLLTPCSHIRRWPRGRPTSRRSRPRSPARQRSWPRRRIDSRPSPEAGSSRPTRSPRLRSPCAATPIADRTSSDPWGCHFPTCT